jgi:hypothetical protein
MKWVVVFVLMMAPTAFAAVGSVTEQTGTAAQIQRNKAKLDINKGTGVEMNDVITTANSKLGLTFQDNTKVKLTEQSRLMIDDFVYDPKKKDAGKLGMKVAIGTVRYASGQVAKNNPQAVALKTPTATIAVRGTDFTMTVDEVGKSLIVLLPSCPDNYKKESECVVGEIEVATDVGSVILNQAFQATMAASRNQPPTTPKLLDLNESQINNLLIISPPKELTDTVRRITQDIGKSFLDQDFLEYKELTKNFLEEDQLKYSELDVNRLDVDYLDNLLDLGVKSLNEDFLETPDGVLPNIKSFAWIPKVYNEETIFIYSERPPHIASVRVERNTSGMINLKQDGVEANIIVNNGGSGVVFNIVQSQ